MTFFDGFLNAQLPPVPSLSSPFSPTPISVQMKDVEVVDSWTNFHLHVTCNSRVMIFQQLFQEKKVAFQAASGWFYGHNPPNSGLIDFKFSPAIKCNLMHQMIESFQNIVNKWPKLGQKTNFWGHFQRFFNNALLRPSICAPIFTPNQRSHEDT